MTDKEKLVSLSNDLLELMGELFQAGAWRDVWEGIDAAHESLLEQIEHLESEDERN